MACDRCFSVFFCRDSQQLTDVMKCSPPHLDVAYHVSLLMLKVQKERGCCLFFQVLDGVGVSVSETAAAKVKFVGKVECERRC